MFCATSWFSPYSSVIPNTTAITLTNSFIHSRLDYSNSLFYGFSNYSIHRLQKVQNTAARIVTHSVRSSHITLVLKSLHWLPANYRINFKICCITHRALSLHEPHYLSSLFSLRSNSLSLHSSSFSPLFLPHFNKNHMVFVHFHMLHLISGITYIIIFVLHQPICRLEKIWKLIFLTKLFLLRLYPYLIWLIWLLIAIPFDCSSVQVGFECHILGELAACK